MEEAEKNILDISETVGAILQGKVSEKSNYIDPEAFKELKHSIRVHMIIANGPSSKLCEYLLKLLDMFDDADKNVRDKETFELAFAIVEAVALNVHRSIDERYERAKNLRQPFPADLRAVNDNIMVHVGKLRSSDDKVTAKNIVLKATAEALRKLSAYTQAAYPDIYNADGVLL
jgi:hypothetical protein